MSAVRPKESEHISLPVLWEYRNGRHQLSIDEIHHLTNCNACLSALGVCRLAKCLEDAERQLKEFST